MPWFRIDDGFSNSEPVVRIPRRYRTSAIGLWTLAGAWSAKELTDGCIPEHMLDELASTPAIAGQLVAAGLWLTAPDGWKFKGWEKYQPTRAEVMEARHKEAERKRKYRESQRDTSGTSAGRTAGHQQASGHPDPTRPDPTSITSDEVIERPAKRGFRLSEDWLPSAESVAVAKRDAPDVDSKAEHPTFIDYWIAQPGQKGVKTNWDSTWRNWMRRKQGDIKSGRVRQTPTERAQQTLTLATEIDMKGIGQ